MTTSATGAPLRQARRASRRRAESGQTEYRPRELDHRLANSLQLAADMLIFEQVRVRDPAARQALVEAAGRLTAVGHLHRFLSAQHDTADVDLDPFLTELCGLIGASTGLACTAAIEPVHVPGDVAQQLAMATNELAMNAVKHAYAKGQPGALHVEGHREGGVWRLTVTDEGEGLGHGFSTEGKGGLGMAILRAIVRQLRGTLHAESDHGARFTIDVPQATLALRPVSRSFAPLV